MCVCWGGGGFQLFYVVSSNRCVNIQSVFWRHRSKAAFGLVLLCCTLCFFSNFADIALGKGELVALHTYSLFGVMWLLLFLSSSLWRR